MNNSENNPQKNIGQNNYRDVYMYEPPRNLKEEKETKIVKRISCGSFFLIVAAWGGLFYVAYHKSGTLP